MHGVPAAVPVHDGLQLAVGAVGSYIHFAIRLALAQ
jgi:hypothetical protein